VYDLCPTRWILSSALKRVAAKMHDTRRRSQVSEECPQCSNWDLHLGDWLIIVIEHGAFVGAIELGMLA
jgi:hypothetical protein